MRSYLIGFFEEFGYEDEDASCLLGAYDKITANAESSALLTESLAAYERDILLDYEVEILNRAKQISALTAIHPYTVDLLVFICLSKHLREVYRREGLDAQIYRDSVLDLKWKLEECKAVKGICGSFVAAWFPRFYKLTRFALGRLQFEVITAKTDYEKNGVVIEKGKTKVINVHIPRTGTPLDRESCDAAYARAREFFKDQVGETCVFVCHSWLLYPENKTILPSRLNTYRFMSEYDIVDWGRNLGEDLWRLFDTDEKNPARLPTDGTFRRCYAEHLKKGGRVGWGLGVKI